MLAIIPTDRPRPRAHHGPARRVLALLLTWLLPAGDALAAGRASATPRAALERAASSPAAATAEPVCARTLFGPRRYDRTTGPPNVYTDIVAVPAGAPSPYTLRVRNGEPDGSHRVSSASVHVNGAQVVGPSDLDQNVAWLLREVTLTPSTTLRVKLQSAPGSYLVIDLCGAGAAPDRTPPELIVAQPAQGAALDDATPAVRVTYRDLPGPGETGASGVALASFRAWVDDAERTALFTRQADQALAEISPALAEGLHRLRAEIADVAGNVAHAEAEFRVDTRPPALEVLAPEEGALVSGEPLEVSGNVTDAGPVSVRVEGLEAVVQCGAPGEPCAWSVAGVSVPEGDDVRLRVSAEDEAGLRAQVERRLRVDREAPVVAFTIPAEGAYVRDPVVEVSGTVADASPVEVEVNGEPASVSGGVFTAHVPGVEGELLLEARARDAVGHEARASRRLVVDTLPPVIEVDQPAVAVTNAAGLPLAGRVRDASPRTLRLDGQPLALQGEAFAATLPLPEERAYTFLLEAEDAAGNLAQRELALTVDRSAPALTLLEPPEGGVVAALPLLVRGLADDPSGVSVLVNGQTAEVVQGLFEVQLEALDEGPQTLAVEATDGAGNTTQATRNVLVDLGPPRIAITEPTPGALTREPSVVVKGTVEDQSRATVAVNGVPAAVEWEGTLGRFSAQVALHEGDNPLEARALDTSGRAAVARTLVTRDSTPPLVDLAAPEMLVRSRPAQALAAVSDASAITAVELLLDGVLIASLDAPPYVVTLLVPEGAAGGQVLTLVARATDAAGNHGVATRTLRVTSAGVVVGQALADESGLPLPGALVRLLAGGQAAEGHSDERGRYAFPVESDEALVRVEAAGRTSVVRPLAVAPGVGSVVVDARLTPLGAPETITPQGGDLRAPLRVRTPSAPPEAGSALAVGVTPAAPEASAEAIVRARLSASSPAAAAAGIAVGFPAGSVAHDTPFRLTSLSAQGLPALLPLGWSPVAAFELRADDGSTTTTAPLALRVDGLASAFLTLHVARFDDAARVWTMLAPGRPVVDGALEASLPGPGTFALLARDAGVTAALPAPGGVLPAAPGATIPDSAIARGTVEPAVLPPSGGTAWGSLMLHSIEPLPSGTFVQAKVDERYHLAAGPTASQEPRAFDVLLYREPLPAAAPEAQGFRLGASFPITPARSFDPLDLLSGQLRLDLVTGRSAVHGQTGGSDPLHVTDGDASLSLPAGALVSNTAVAVQAVPVSEHVPQTQDVVALAEVDVDFSGQRLLLSAELAWAGVPEAPGATWLIARVRRVQGVPKVEVVALGQWLDGRVASRAYPGLDGVREGGRYVLYHLATAPGFVAGVTRAEGQGVPALVGSAELPFVALADAFGAYLVAARVGNATLHASVPGTSLVGSAEASVSAGATSALDIDLAGSVTHASVRPANGSLAVPLTQQVEIEVHDAALDPDSVSAASVRLLRREASGGAFVPVAARLVLSASRRLLALVPEQALAPDSEYRLDASGLLDAHGGLVSVPPTSFRTTTDAPPEYDLNALVISVPDEFGNVRASVPPGVWPDGVRVLIVNAGNGVVASYTYSATLGLEGEFAASVEDRLFLTFTDPLGHVTHAQRSQYYDEQTGFTTLGAGGGVVSGAGGVELRLPEGALAQPLKLKVSAVDPAELPADEQPQDPHAFVGGALRLEASHGTLLDKELDVVFPVPAQVQGRLDDPTLSFWVLRRVRGPNDAWQFEVVDVARLEGTGAARKVVTASRPFRGYEAVREEWWRPAEYPLGIGSEMLFLVCQLDVTVATPLPGVVSGRVMRARWSASGALEYEPVGGASVVGRDAQGNELIPAGGSFGQSATDGSYALIDRAYTGGPVTVTASVQGQRFTATGHQLSPSDVLNLYGFLGRFNVARVNLLLPAEAPAPPPPQVRVRLFTLEDGQRREAHGGLVSEGVPLLVGLTPGDAQLQIEDVEIRGQRLRLVDDAQLGHVVWDDARPDGLYVPGSAGSYTLRARVVRVASPPEAIEIAYTFRAVGVGGGVVTDHANPPEVLEGATLPRRGAQQVPVSVLPQLAFSEPVRQVRSNLALEDQGAPVAVRLLGLGPQGPIEDVTDDDVVTAVTLQPLQGLRYGRAYTLRVRAGVRDLDQTPDGQDAPKNLPEDYETSFSTFTPEGLPGQTEAIPIAGFALHEGRAYVAQTAYAGQLGAQPTQYGELKVFDVADPAEMTLVAGPERILGPPLDLVYDDGLVAVPTFPRTAIVPRDFGNGVWGQELLSGPANLHVFEVDADRPRWVGAVSLTQGILDGVPRRALARGQRVYLATRHKGVQVVDLGPVLADFPQPGTPAHSAMLRDLGAFGSGFGLEHVVTIPVRDAQDKLVDLADIELAQIDVAGELRTLVLGAGFSPQDPSAAFVVVDPASLDARRVPLQAGGQALVWGTAVGFTRVGGRPLALVGGTGAAQGGANLLAVVDLSPLATGAPPALLALLQLTARPTDIAVAPDGTVVVAGGGQATLVSVSAPESPLVLGRIPGVGSRIALSEDGLLISTNRTMTTGAPDPLQGLHAAAFRAVGLIHKPALTFARVVEGASAAAAQPEEETTRDIPVTLQIVPADPAVTEAELEIRDAQSQRVHVPITAGLGTFVLPAGYRRPLGATTLARMRFQSAEGLPAQSSEREIPISAATLRLDSDNDSVIHPPGTPGDDADRDAAAQDTKFVFWEADPAADTHVDPTRALPDYATVSLRFDERLLQLAPDEKLGLRLEGSAWELRRKVDPQDFKSQAPELGQACGAQPTHLCTCLKEGKGYLCHKALADAQRKINRGEDDQPAPQPRSGGLIEIPRALLKGKEAQFLFRCPAREGGARACPASKLELVRILPSGEVDSTPLASAPIEIMPLQKLTGMVSARRDITPSTDPLSDHFAVSPTVHHLTDWGALPLDDQTKQVTVLVHGYNVADAEFRGTHGSGWFGGWVKRLYWAGHPTLRAQRAWTLGVLWPGDVPGTFDTALYFPEDEWNALQSGLPVGRLLATLRTPQGNYDPARVNIFAHSLGNLVVNNALKEVPVSGGAPVNYVMNDAAVPGEAFEQDYYPVTHAQSGPGAPGVARLLSHARQLGYPQEGDPAPERVDEDALWRSREEAIEGLRQVHDCPSGATFPKPSTDPLCTPVVNLPPPHCVCDDVTRYFERRAAVRQVLDICNDPQYPCNQTARTPFFSRRWRKTRNADDSVGGAWTGFFRANVSQPQPNLRLFNTYNRTDVVLRLDRSPATTLQPPWDKAPAWLICQLHFKPLVRVNLLSLGGVVSVLLGGDGTEDLSQRWWTLEVAGRANSWATTEAARHWQLEVWGGRSPVPGRNGAATPLQRSREWAELAMWFPALSVPVGASAMPSLAQLTPPSLPFDSQIVVQGRNIDLTALGGDGGVTDEGTLSHSYMQVLRVDEVWKGFRVVRQLFGTQ